MISCHDSKISNSSPSPMGSSANSTSCSDIVSFSGCKLICLHRDPLLRLDLVLIGPHVLLILFSLPSCCFLTSFLNPRGTHPSRSTQPTWISRSSELLCIWSFFGQLWHLFIYCFASLLNWFICLYQPPLLDYNFGEVRILIFCFCVPIYTY